MKLYEMISNLKFVGIKNFKDIDIDALSCKSEEKLTNGMFFCINGLKNDGHKFAEQSVKNGAVCLVVERYVDLPLTQILVEDVRVAMSFLSAIFYETYKSKMKFIGITGTNGKTTTTFVMREILTRLNKKVGLIGTEGIYINSLLLPASLTTPDPIDLHKIISDMEHNGCEFCVMEVSAHAIALNKIDNIMFDVVGLSNITQDHLDFFLNMDNYINCKASLFDVKHAKCGVVNCNDKFAKTVKKKSNLEITAVGKNGDLQLLQTEQTFLGSKFKITYKQKSYTVKTNLVGNYNIDNIQLAIACLINVGFDVKEIVSTINHTTFEVPGRFNVLKTSTTFNVVVDYAHTPDGIKNVLSTLKQLKKGKIITVFGCGGDRDKTKRSEMGEIAVSLSDKVIVTSDNPRSENPELIIEDIVQKIDKNKYIKITDRQSAIEHALTIAKQGDVVAILGKGAENYQEINGFKIHFSDYEVVDEFLKKQTKSVAKI